MNIASKCESRHVFRVKSEATLELVIAKWWANLGEVPLNWKITFNGLEPSVEAPCLMAAEGVYRLDIRSSLKQVCAEKIEEKNPRFENQSFGREWGGG